MGKICEFTCPACQSSWTINIGHGLRHATLENVCKAFPAEIQQKIKETAAEEHLPLFEFNYRAALCPQCKAVISVPVIRFLQTGKSYIGVCPECGNSEDCKPQPSDPGCGSQHCGGSDSTATNGDDCDCGDPQPNEPDHTAPLSIIDDDMACLCPHCEKTQLSVQDIGNWD